MNPTRPQATPATLAEQLAAHRQSVVRIAALLAARPDLAQFGYRLDQVAERAAAAIGTLERAAATPPPGGRR